MSQRYLLLVVIPLTLAYFWPLVFSPLIGDDIHRAGISAYAQGHGYSIDQAVRLATATNAREHGGWFPASRLPFFLWTTVTSEYGAKVLQLSLVTFNVVTFAFLAVLATGSTATGWLAVAMFFVCFEFRKPHDPILTGSFTWPLTAECVLLAFGFWFAFCAAKSARNLALAAALVAYTCAALLDESTYPLAAGFVALALLSRRRGTYVAAGAFVLVPLAAVLATSALHVSQARSIDRLVHTAGGSYGKTLALQAFAAIPTSYRASAGVIKDGVSPWSADARFLSVPSPWLRWFFASLFAAVVAGVLLVRTKRPCEIRYARQGAVTGSAMWLLPAILGVGSPGQWVGGLPVGEAFDAIYLSYFGIALLIAVTLRSMTSIRGLAESHWQRTSAICVSLYVFYTVYGNVRYNAYVINLDLAHEAPVADLRRALHESVISRLGGAPTFVLSDRFNLETKTDDYRHARWLITPAVGARVTLLPKDAIRVRGALCKSSASRTCEAKTIVWYVWSPLGKGSNEPTVQLARWTASVGEKMYGDMAYGFYAYGSSAESRSAALTLLAGSFNGPVNVWQVDGTNVLLGVRLRCGSLPLETLLEPRSIDRRCGTKKFARR